MAKKTVKKEEAAAVNTSSLVLGPRITEKSAYAAEKNVYVFNVATGANKIQIRQEIKSLYKVTPVKIAIVVNKPKNVMFRGRPGQKSGFKKAYITLKKGDTIELN